MGWRAETSTFTLTTDTHTHTPSGCCWLSKHQCDRQLKPARCLWYSSLLLQTKQCMLD